MWEMWDLWEMRAGLQARHTLLLALFIVGHKTKYAFKRDPAAKGQSVLDAVKMVVEWQAKYAAGLLDKADDILAGLAYYTPNEINAFTQREMGFNVSCVTKQYASILKRRAGKPTLC